MRDFHGVPVILWITGIVVAAGTVTAGGRFGERLGDGLRQTLPILALALLIFVMMGRAK